MFLFAVLNTLVLFVLTWIGFKLYQRYKSYQLFRNLGIPGPPPHFITGNGGSVRMGTKLPLNSIKTWGEKYGKIFGYYRSGLPVLVISDLDMLKQIVIKDFHNFTNRGRSRIAFKPNDDSLLGLRGERWKDARRVLNPTFTTSKIKQLSHIVSKKIDTFEEEIDKMAAENGSHSEFDIYERFQRLTMDVIGECALAMKIDCQHDSENLIYRGVQGFMKGGSSNLAYAISFVPGMDAVLNLYVNSMPFIKVAKSVSDNLYSVIRMRRKRKHNDTIDVLQLMLNTTTDVDKSSKQGDKDLIEDSADKSSALGSSSRVRRIQPLNDDEIVGNCWAFLIAGYETTATALAYVAHQLVHHPDIQQKVYEEIVKMTQPDQIPTYEEAHSLQYLDQVINETLRLYPPVVLFMTRECAQDYDLNGIKIPAGMKIEIPIYSIHHDPELWPDPEKFDPERFSPENKSKIHPMAHIPFGAGPRNCIGMRFALLEAKLTLIRLIRKYRLEPCDKTKDPPEVTVPHATFVPKNGIYLKVVPRDY